MILSRLPKNHYSWIIILVVAASIITGLVFYEISLRIVHLLVVPCFICYIVILRKNAFTLIRWYHLLYFGLLAAIVAVYLVTLARIIPEICVLWTELPIAIWFLLSIHIIVWFIDRVINTALSAFLGSISDVHTLRRLYVPKTILRIFCVTAIAAPYLLATFQVHWVKFGDNTDPLRQYGMDFKQVHFQAADATKLEGWFIPTIRNASDSTVIIAPGRGTTKACFLPYVMALSAYSYNVLLFDLRGQGASCGHTQGFGLLEANDVLGAVRYLRQAHPEASRYIFGLGIAHGAPAVITAAARDERIRAVALDSSIIYSSSLPEQTFSWLSRPINAYIETATRAFASVILGRNLFRDTICSDIAKINPRPVLIFHGSADKVADYTQAKRLYEFAKKPKKLCIVPGAEHEQVLLYMKNRYIDEISSTFLTWMIE